MMTSREHSLELLSEFRERDTFMESIGTLADFGCGKEGHDLEWWAGLTTRDDIPEPLNIKVTGVDIVETCLGAHKHKNATYLNHDLEKPFGNEHRFDIVWCHDTLQYMINPFQTLCNWRNVVDAQGALIISLPQNIQMFGKYKLYDQKSHCIYNWTIVQLIHMLTLAGWESAYYKVDPLNGWINAMVYNTREPVRDPRTTSWYNLAETNLLPPSAVNGINRRGYLREQDLVLQWIDRSYTELAKL